MFTKAGHIKPSANKAHHPAFQKVQQNDSFVPAIQPKLQVDSPSSSYELEADRMADHVVANASFVAPTNFVSSPPVQTSAEPIATQSPELDAGEIADQLLPPMPGEDASVTNEDADPKTSVDEEKTEKQEPEVVEEQVKKKDSKEPKGGKGGGKGAPMQEEEPPVPESQGEEVSAADAAAFAGEPKLEPVGPIEITPDLTSQFVQTKMDESQQFEEEQEIQEESTEGTVHSKLFDESGGASQDDFIQRSGDGAPEVSSKTEQGIANSKSGGHAMDGHTQQFMESQFQSDFSGVKVHTDDSAVSLNNQLRSKAFTHENHIYFNEGQYAPGTTEGHHLLAHELTHVVQQDASIQRKPQISSAPAPKVQRLGISDALDYFADKAYHIPGYRMFTVILGLNPINMSRVERSPANIMRAMVEFLPGGFLITQALDNHGVFDKASVWFKQQIDTLGVSGSSIRNAINEFLDSLGWSDIFDLGGVWRRAKRIFTTPIKRLINFAKGLVTTIIDMVKSAILRPLAALAEGTAAYDLLRVVLGSDPITGDPYPPTAENLIGGFMKLIGQEEIWENIKKGNAIERAYEWFKGAMSGLLAFVTAIPTTIIDTLKSLTWQDIVLLPKAFVKVGKVFLNVAGKFLEWAGGTVLSLLEIIFTVVAPGAIPWIKKAGAGFSSILENPIGFVGNLIKAAKDGFLKFAANIGKHLKAALINWLMGSLAGAGIYIPTGLNFQEIIKFVLSVLGISWANIRIKLVKHLGEPAVKALETGFELVTLLITKGPMAMWERIMEHISDLKTMVMTEIMSWVVTKVVTKAITKLVSSLNPAGAVIQAIIVIYDTVTFLIDKIKQIASVGFAILDSIVNIANGVLGAAVKKVEKTLAGLLTLAINFLAHFLGLGKVSEKIVSIIKKLKDKVDKALDKVIGWLVKQAKKFLKKIVTAGTPKDPKARLDKGLKTAVSAVNKLKGKATKKLIDPVLKAIKVRYEFQSLTAVEKGGLWVIKGKINPEGEAKTNKKVDESGENEVGHDPAATKLKATWVGKTVITSAGAINKTFEKAAKKAGYQFFENEGKKQIRRSDAAKAPKLSIVDKVLQEGAGGSSKPTHDNFIPDVIKITENNGTYTATYSTKSADGTKTAEFKIDITFDTVVEGIPNKVQTRKVKGTGLTNKGANIGRGKWDSAVGGFDNAHIIGDQFGGAGKNAAMNIHPSSPEYNRTEMAGIENKMASTFKQNVEKYDLEATAYLSDDNESPAAFKNFLAAEFKKDNAANATIPKEITSTAENKLIKSLQKNITQDVLSLPAKFMKVTYHSESIDENMEGVNIDKKSKTITLGEDKGYKELYDKHKAKEASSGTTTQKA
ncbi:MAG: DUF4157 domain-containing protein [Saprospiraceae bacterium]|nr:DUF4157 domain-containing protein [Saprospiraceae bacterium]